MSNNSRARETLWAFLVLSSVILSCHPAVIGLQSRELDILEAQQSSLESPLGLDGDYGDEEEEEGAGAQTRLPGGGRASPAELGAQFPPSSLLNVAANPLRDQPNLSSTRASLSNQMIYGSRKAFTVTKVEYLKKEWCKTEPLKQVIREEGCLQRTVVNRFCYGQCNSFFIPKSNKKDLESAAFKSCSFCKPKRYSWITVTLRCPRRKPRFKRKRVQIIKRCKCMAQKLD